MIGLSIGSTEKEALELFGEPHQSHRSKKQVVLKYCDLELMYYQDELITIMLSLESSDRIQIPTSLNTSSLQINDKWTDEYQTSYENSLGHVIVTDKESGEIEKILNS